MSATDQSSSDFESPEQIAQSATDEVSVEIPDSESNEPTRAPSAAQREPSSWSLLFLMACVLFLAAWFVGPRLVEEYQFAATKGKLRAEYENAVTILENQPLKKVSMASQLVAQKVKPSVVSIRTRKLSEGTNESDFANHPNAVDPERRGLEGLLRQREERVMGGYGSGLIVSTDGYIVTNAHVTVDSKRIWVELHDRRTYRAIEVGRDESSDIAVLKIEADDLIPATWADSEELEVGSMVWAIGSPYHYEQTVTSGIISAKDRVGEPDGKVRNLLQTDTAINPGSSGGPLVNADGNVVGIIVSIFGKTFQGISFAVPSATVRFVYEQILERGKVVRGYLGVRPDEVSHRHAKQFGLPDLEGAMLYHVEPDSPAGRAGLQRFDVVRTWNETPIRSYNSLYRLAERSLPGSVVEVSLLREGEPYTASITIGEVPEFSSGFRVEVQE